MEEKFNKTTYTNTDNGYIVLIDLKNQKHLVEVGQLILKQEAKSLNQFANGILYYWSKQKLS